MSGGEGQAVVSLLDALAPPQLAAVVPLLGVLSLGGGLGRDAARCAAAWWRCPWPCCHCSMGCYLVELGGAVMPLLGALSRGGAGRSRCSAARYAVAWWRRP
ncbi:hypothetical protein ACFFKC_23050, partial [Pseudoduganella danionis]|uniref:hypothetical protein n=1 Tax=Pseudoduganella danionis TaxID=1890295 RepID=UPI0035E75A54